MIFILSKLKAEIISLFSATDIWEKLDAGIEQPQPRHDFSALTFILNMNQQTSKSEDYGEETGLAELASSSSVSLSTKYDVSDDNWDDDSDKTKLVTRTNTSQSRKKPSKLSYLNASLTGLNRMSSYVHLLNESEESLPIFGKEENESSSLCTKMRKQEPFCIFNCRSDKAELHFPHSSQDIDLLGVELEGKNSQNGNISSELEDTGRKSYKNNGNMPENKDDTHALFAKALKNSFEDKSEDVSGVELRETQEEAHIKEPNKSKFHNNISVMVVGGMVEGQVSWKEEVFQLWQVKVIK